MTFRTSSSRTLKPASSAVAGACKSLFFLALTTAALASSMAMIACATPALSAGGLLAIGAALYCLTKV